MNENGLISDISGGSRGPDSSALALLAVVAWYAFGLRDATQGAAIICTGAVLTVAVFVTGRVVGESDKKR